jgi:hypothetical protein
MHKSWLHQAMCSVNLAIIIVSIYEEKGRSAFLGKLAYPAYTYLFPLLRRVYHDESFQRTYLFFSMCLLLAAMIFLLVRVLNYFLPLRSFLLVWAGVASVSAYPLACLWLRWLFLRISPTQALGLLLETVAVIISAVLYLYRRWPIPGLLSVLLLGSHFAIWTWVSGSFGVLLDTVRAYGPWNLGFWTVILSALLLPILGILASLTWGIYTRTVTGTLTPQLPSLRA